MKRIRVIPTLLLQNGGLVKSIKFNNHTYVGDPINAVKIFNEKQVDEIVILDISASREKRIPNLNQIKELSSEAFMPLGYGGGINSLDVIKELISSGVEKVVLNTSAVVSPDLVDEGARYVGSQSVVVSIDVKKDLWGRYRVYYFGGKRNSGRDPYSFAKEMQERGAGEILLNSIDKDGTFSGYDTKLIEWISSAVSIPIVALGGASDVNDLAKAIRHGASAVAAGSMFVFQKPHRAVLISYPSQAELKKQLFSKIKEERPVES